MSARVVLILGLCFGCAITGCSGEPTSCEEAACDGASEMCVLFGSDTLAPDSASCQPIIEGCEEDRTCACLDSAIGDDGNNRFCFDAGGCELNEGVLELVCPGG